MKNLWQKRTSFCLLFFIVFVASFSLALAEDESEPGDIPVSTFDRGKTTHGRNAPQHQHPSSSLSSSHSRRRRQAFDGFRFSDLFRIFNSGALEGVDTMLRSTRNFDVFQCLERLSCEMAAPIRNDGSSAPEVVEEATEVAAEDPTGHAVQQPFLQGGIPQGAQFIQPGLQQIPGFVQPGLQYIPQAGIPQYIPQIPQFAYPQYVHPGGQFIHPAASYVQPQYIPLHPSLLQPSLQQLSIQGNHAAQTGVQSDAQETHAMPAVAHGMTHGAAPIMEHHTGGQVHRSGEHGETPATKRVEFEDDYQTPWQQISSRHFFQGYRDRIRRRQEKRNWFGRMFQNIKNEYYRRNPRSKRDVSSSSKISESSELLRSMERLIVDTLKELLSENHRSKRDVSTSSKNSDSLRRKKRSIVDTFKKMWRNNDVVGALDRMMEGTNDSLYPYTKAALMGYTGDEETCDTLYSACPTSIDEVIETFNNLNSRFPNGMPFRDRIPRPFRYLIP